MKANVKLWIEDDGGLPIFGDGRLKLLEAIKETGSLKAASERLGMLYRHAWGQVKKMEERMKVRLTEPTTGGKHGGGSVLTADAEKIIKEFAKMKRDINRYVEKRSSRLFG